MIKTNKGITLVALVVTIIVLIILAGISINLVLGENGIITRAQAGAEKYANGAVNEETQINNVVAYIDSIISGEGSTTPSTPTQPDVKEITATYINNDTTNAYIGKYVNYGGSANFKGVGWRILDSQNGHILLIADNYISNEYIPTAEGIYVGDSLVLQDADVEGRTVITNYLSSNSVWSNFNANGATVTGGPSVEQITNAYNRTHDDKISIKMCTTEESGVDANGYRLKIGNGEYANGIYAPNITDFNDLYAISSNTIADMYFTSSPSTAHEKIMISVGKDGIGGANTPARYGVRPVVTLPSGAVLEEQSNGTLNIK